MLQRVCSSVACRRRSILAAQRMALPLSIRKLQAIRDRMTCCKPQCTCCNASPSAGLEVVVPSNAAIEICRANCLSRRDQPISENSSSAETQPPLKSRCKMSLSFNISAQCSAPRRQHCRHSQAEIEILLPSSARLRGRAAMQRANAYAASGIRRRAL